MLSRTEKDLYADISESSARAESQAPPLVRRTSYTQLPHSRLRNAFRGVAIRKWLQGEAMHSALLAIRAASRQARVDHQARVARRGHRSPYGLRECVVVLIGKFDF